ncbi:hypothetical protein POX_b02661 [Penicillium oxalicum]|uniref:Secreted protein n=1 Tax=Penicillium oxalicum (strain 114-2 / CGMCC 5302) TaxID=933388 RepID=S8AVS9_PENO1|nr:hypothetical protein POX_b02661 [Penicillium oxalicum]EPS30328.1 hypothetical protein PDE_05279 [Penicillium oxalicum 114-2]KAI2792622.1 hypothetical protein POX_b02661 [Penicillium oxalicum]
MAPSPWPSAIFLFHLLPSSSTSSISPTLASWIFCLVRWACPASSPIVHPPIARHEILLSCSSFAKRGLDKTPVPRSISLEVHRRQIKAINDSLCHTRSLLTRTPLQMI